MNSPIPPPGSDPFAYYEAWFIAIFSPTPGYKARIILLGSLTALVPVLAAVLFGLHLVALRRKKGKFWLFKRVKRDAGTYVVGARLPLLCIAAVCVATTLGGTLIGNYKFTANFTYGTKVDNAFMSTFWITSFAVFWMYSCSNLQTYLLVDGERRFRIKPAFMNLLFLGGLGLGVAVLLALVIFNGVITASYIARQDAFFTFLFREEAKYNGTVDAATQATLDKLLTDYFGYWPYYYGTLEKLILVFSVTPAPVLIVNISAVALYLIMRRQRHDNEENVGFRGQSDSSGRLSTDSEKAKALKAVEHGLLVDAISVASWSLGILITSVWSTAIFPDVPYRGWGTLEATLYSPTWCAIVPLCFALIAQVILAWAHLPQPARASAEGTVPSFMIPQVSKEGGEIDEEKSVGKDPPSAHPDGSGVLIHQTREVEIGEPEP
ncbi:hypothetical protein BCR35DRAFT_328339 [Leucosporidium creatinivorum]|uniref:Proteophosphoglycan ppg4 n=1 Tax=Leucosporidium creatinivorum TaxID=106004 RepID=A0A1Y2G5H6_9BASI|nr:hypothetical protein BCR35DRAFT_328339 [Leucosporidium creatinivorum]